MCSYENIKPQWNSLKQKTPLKRKTPMKRGKPLNKVSKVKHRRLNRSCPPAIAKAIKERSGGICEFVDEIKRRCNCEATCFQHRKKKSQGGKYTLENLKHSCWNHNLWAETLEGKKLAPKLGWTIL